MRVAIVFMILLLLPLALAAEVTERNSGIMRGSIAFTFTYNPADTAPTVIEGIQQGDVITIITGQTKTGMEEKFELFFKSRVNGKWGYEIVKGEKGLSIAVGETTPFDVNGNGSFDLTMEYTAFDPIKQATITFYPSEPSVVTTMSKNMTETLVVNETTMSKNMTETLVVNETVEAVDVDEIAEPLPDRIPTEPMQHQTSILPILIVILVILLIGGAWFVKKSKSA